MNSISVMVAVNARKIRKKIRARRRQRKGGGPFIDYIYKEPIRLLHHDNNLIRLLSEDAADRRIQTDVFENIDGKVTEVGSSTLQVLNMMKMLDTQVAQLTGCLSSNEGKLSGQPQSPEMAKAIQTRSGKETEEPDMRREQGSLSQKLKWRPSSRRRHLLLCQR